MAGEGGTGARARKDMARLLQFCASGACRASAPREGKVEIVRDDASAYAAAETVVTVARRVGLVAAGKKNAVAITPAGKAWLKRHVAAQNSMTAEACFAAQHRDTVTETREVAGAKATVSVNLNESPLASLARLKSRDGDPYLDEDAFMAGERLRRDFSFAALQPRISSNWEAGVSATKGKSPAIGDLTDHAIAARDRVSAALGAVGPELSGVLLDICCFLKGLETVERERQWPVRSGKLMLRTALNALSRHYGYRN
ncbi:DUF6456 domain-containing protein [Pararhizobium haloflavum]|uniref:DUF6456 domain-containing protein n=1 Tax=Pararhizobium haloflavum TaxID=2037914 RepID=UPI000C1A2E85|nr:DUF6456 domain-containing protein [Pararhizobium haloflavum]